MRIHSPLPVLGVIYLASLGITALDAAKEVEMGWVTTLAWWVVVSGALGFIGWIVIKVVAAARGAAA